MRPNLRALHLAAIAMVAVTAGCGGDDTSATSTTTTSAPVGGDPTTVTVVASDYAFAGLPDVVDIGPTTFAVVNEGAEVHELALFRRHDGVTQSVEELLSLPDEEVLDLISPVSGTDAEQLTAEVGQTATGTVDLEPGDYIAICLVPVGLTDFETDPPPDAEPHAARGMVTEFTAR